MNSPESGNGEWQARRMGATKPVLPEGSRVKRLNMDTRTHIEYGEKTWTTGQTIRDILQNHLDAHTQEFFEEIVSKVVDTEQLAKKELGPEQIKQFDKFTYRLYLYRLGLGDRTPEAETQMVKSLNQSAWGLPIRAGFLNRHGEFDEDRLQIALGAIREKPLQLKFKVRDAANPSDKGHWVSQELLANHLRYQEQMVEEGKKKPLPNFRYKISGMEIEDSGSGFDNTLTAFYKSTKTGKRHLRGKFGEGDKMSRTHLVRHGATMRSRSRYFINSGQNKERLWQHRPYLDPKGQKVKLKGVEIEMPKAAEGRFGSSTRIDAKEADESFAADFALQVDPRFKDAGLAANCLSFSRAIYAYPAVESGYLKISPVGVSLEASPSLQYVQGLRVGEELISPDPNLKLFSYNFLNSSIIGGRDRNQINGDAARLMISNFWRHAESQELIIELIKRVYLLENPKRYVSASVFPEDWAVQAIMKKEFPDQQSRRVHGLFLDNLPKVLGIKEGSKYVLATKEDLEKGGDKLRPLLEKKGFRVLELQHGLSKNEIDTITEHHNNSFILHDFETIKKLMEGWDLTEGLQAEQLERLRPVFDQAMQSFFLLLERLGKKAPSIEPESSFAAAIDPAKEQPVEMEFLSTEGKFRIRVRPEIIFNRDAGIFDPAYWQDRMVVELLSTVERTDGFDERVAALQHAQEIAQELVDKNSASDPEILRELLESFRYQEGDERKYQNSFFEKLQNVQENLRAWASLESAGSMRLTLAQFESLVSIAPTLPEPYQYKYLSILSSKIVIENGEIGFCTRSIVGKESVLEFQTKLLNDLEVVGEVEGNKVYRLAAPHNDRLFVLANLPSGTVIRQKDQLLQNDQSHVVFENQLLTFAGKSFQIYNSQFFSINSQCLALSGYFGETTGLTEKERSHAIKKLAQELDNIKIIYPENGKLKSMERLNGIVQTPLPIEYGKDEWNNPVRVFQDIVQNHLDAAVDGLVTLKFEVVRNGQRLWVTKEDMAQADLIVGFSVSDNGSGYAPDDLGTMGKSSKKSPLFAGKYGEGQKMVAAAAARMGLDLEFSSIAEHNGRQYRWTGSVASQPQEIIVGGQLQQEQRVVFDIQSQVAKSEGFASSTILKLPEGSTGFDNSEWKNWVSIIDPRIKDEWGNEGLSRFVINLRERDRANVIDMGYMRILLNEPGRVYENGLLITQKSDVAFGYDVPEIVTTRERNAYDEAKLRSYISHAFSHCQDSRLAREVLKKFKAKYLPGSAKNFRGRDIEEPDLNFGRLSLYGLDAKPYWDFAFAQELPGMLVTSRDAIKKHIGYILEQFQGSDSSGIDAETLNRLQMTLVNLPHIPEDQLIDVPDYQYPGFSNVFPTAESYTLSIAEQEVAVEDQVRSRLNNLVAERGRNLTAVLVGLPLAEYRKLIIKSADTSKYFMFTPANDKVFEQSLFWSSPQLQEQHPDAVFVAPANAGYLGTVKPGRLGINEMLFTPEMINRLIGTIDHELVHKLTDLGDYIPEFIIMLLKAAEYNFNAEK